MAEEIFCRTLGISSVQTIRPGPGRYFLKSNMIYCWFKDILLVNTKGSGVAKLRRKPSPNDLLLVGNCVLSKMSNTVVNSQLLL